MQNANATKVKNRFGEFMEKAMLEPVNVQKTGRSVIVMISRKEYDRLMAIEDAYWGERARLAETGRFLKPKKSMEFLRKLAIKKSKGR